MTNLVEFKNVRKSFGRTLVLEDMSFTVNSGSIIGLLGPNGAGKTTMLKLMNGLLQPDSGEVSIAGLKPGLETKKMISYLPDKPYFNSWMKVDVLLNFFQDFYEDFQMDKAKDMLKDLKIESNARLKTLSKGTKEKVQLVLVMSRKAKLYLLDEPIGGVDPATREYILNTIIRNYSEDAALMISTHLIQDIEKVLDEVLLVSNKKIYLQDTVDDIREKHGKSVDALFREVYSWLENY